MNYVHIILTKTRYGRYTIEMAMGERAACVTGRRVLMQWNELDEWPNYRAQCAWPGSTMPPTEVVAAVRELMQRAQAGKIYPICTKSLDQPHTIKWAKWLLAQKVTESTPVVPYKFNITDRKAYVWLVRDGVRSKKAFFKVLPRNRFEATEFAKKFCTPSILKCLMEQMEAHTGMFGGIECLNRLYTSQDVTNRLEELYSVNSEIVFGFPQAQEEPKTIEPDAFTDTQFECAANKFEPTKTPEPTPSPSIKPSTETVTINSKLLLI